VRLWNRLRNLSERARQINASPRLLPIFRPPHILLRNIKLPNQNGDWLIQQIQQREAQTSQFLPALAITFTKAE
jgi:response regulator RpfG family c-di-GMP phosphodiesterase